MVISSRIQLKPVVFLAITGALSLALAQTPGAPPRLVGPITLQPSSIYTPRQVASGAPITGSEAPFT